MLKIVLLPLAAVASLGGDAAFATEIKDTRKVAFNPASLRTEAGVAALQRRAAIAARDLCRAQGRRPLAEAAHYRACVATATADAAQQIERAVRLARRSPAPLLAER